VTTNKYHKEATPVFRLVVFTRYCEWNFWKYRDSSK